MAGRPLGPAALPCGRRARPGGPPHRAAPAPAPAPARHTAPPSPHLAAGRAAADPDEEGLPAAGLPLLLQPLLAVPRHPPRLVAAPPPPSLAVRGRIYLMSQGPSSPPGSHPRRCGSLPGTAAAAHAPAQPAGGRHCGHMGPHRAAALPPSCPPARPRTKALRARARAGRLRPSARSASSQTAPGPHRGAPRHNLHCLSPTLEAKGTLAWPAGPGQ